MKQPRYSKNNLKDVNTVKQPEKAQIKQTKEEMVMKPTLVQRFPKSVLAVKVFAILAIVVGVVRYTDKKDYFKPNLSFHEAKLASSFEKFTNNESVDILILGNSICGAGINCNILTSALGSNVYCFYSSGGDVKDAYFNLIEALTKCKPKYIILETFIFGDVMSRSMPMSSKVRNFRLRTNLKEKVLSTPHLFKIEEWAGAWSSSVKNHNFLFRDTAQITMNMSGNDYAEPKNYFLGDSNINKEGMTDSTEAFYQTKGPLIDGAKSELQDFDEEYLTKIKNTCAENDIKIIYLTLPFYYKHFVNTELWRKKLETLIDKDKDYWLDLQTNYDTINYPKSVFENDYKVNQHLVYNGAEHTTYVLANFMRDSLKLDLPDRTTEKHWHDVNYGHEGYLYFYPARKSDTTNINIIDHKVVGKYEINNAFYAVQEKNNILFVKFEKNDLLNGKKTLKTAIKGKYKEKDLATVVDMNKLNGVMRYPIYYISFIKDFKPTDITALENQ